MKKVNKSLVYKVCTMCLALSTIIYYHCPSMLFWGEPEFPIEK